MSPKAIRILNFDSSLTQQTRLLEIFSPCIVNLENLAPFVRHWISPQYAQNFCSRLDPQLKDSLTFLGSGDFHHLSSLLIRQFTQPLSVIIFDHHPDWDTLPPKFGCGSWVSRVLEQENIRKVILLGAASRDLKNPKAPNLAVLKSGRMEIIPIADSAVLLSEALKRLPTKEIYLSIDKDCLKSTYALTNWEEGNLGLDELLFMLGLLKERCQIIAADLCGEYSLPVVHGWLKKIVSYFDHPGDYTAKDKSASQIIATNERTNLSILKVLRGI